MKSSDCHLVEQTLSVARPWKLEAEVMWSALTMAAEANEHGLTMEDVLDAALGVWDLSRVPIESVERYKATQEFFNDTEL